MKDEAAGSPARAPLWYQRFLRTDSRWSWRAWVLFCGGLVLCRMQAVPSWTHPDLRLDWHPSIWFGVMGVLGAVTGFVVAKYRLAGLLAGALAGSGSLLTASLILQRIIPYSRTVDAVVAVLGLLPGVALYCVLHLLIDSGRTQSFNRADVQAKSV